MEAIACADGDLVGGVALVLLEVGVDFQLLAPQHLLQRRTNPNNAVYVRQRTAANDMCAHVSKL
jgi:hypothetical protein